MTLVDNDPSVWPFINLDIWYSYWMVAAGVVVVYDLVLTLGQEIDLIWTQHWSFMTVLYLVIRYVGIPYSVANILGNTTLASLTDAGCNIMFITSNVTNVVVTAMLGVIMIARLHAMYQRSRRMLIFLVNIFLAVNIACGVIAIIVLKYDIVSEELILSGIHMCGDFEDDHQLLLSMVWMINTVWEVLALCLSVWIAAKRFRDLRRLGPWTGSTIGDCFRVLIESHVLYFASFAGVSCLQLQLDNTPKLKNSTSVAAGIPSDALQILMSVQMFVLGPRLILSVRQYHANGQIRPETSMNLIVFQERVHVPTSSTV